MEPVTPSDSSAGKRKRSPSASLAPLSAPAAKVSKTNNSLSINYLARQSLDDLPLLNKDDTLPNLIQLLTAYSNILDRHESLASNLGARPLGPILIKRFERCFDAPPKIVASHHKGGSTNPEDTTHQITWLEVIEFARSHSTQFTLSTFSEGRRVCQFYYPQKQLRVQISEEDFLFINSGRCQELIPPLPIWEDEEKEVGTCDVLEAKLKELTNVADVIAARTRQLSHRLKGRRAAILERRAEGGSGTPAKASAPQTTTAPLSSVGTAFTAVNSGGREIDTSPATFAAVRSELVRYFESLPQNQAQPRSHSRHHSTTSYVEAASAAKYIEKPHTEQTDGAASTTSSLSPVPPNLANDLLSYHVTESAPLSRASHGPSTGHPPSVSLGGHTYNVGPPSSKHNFSRPLPPALESTQPFRPLCQAHMDSLPRGHRVLPPCDRCRRLRMDCVKNLTSCAGCTKKHARCHWRDVSRDELGELDHLMDQAYPQSPVRAEDHLQTNGYVNGDSDLEPEESDDDDSNPLEDLEALGEKEDQREKELAERAREDEEGLRNARELAKQGRDETIRSATVHEVQDSTIDTGGAVATVPNQTVHTRKTEPAVSAATNANAEPAAPEQSPAQVAAKDSAAAPAFIPLPLRSPTAEMPSSHAGFHAVNSQWDSIGGGWSAI